MNKNEIKALLAKYRANACTEAELELLESWYLEFENTGFPDLSDAEKEADLDEIWKSMPVRHPRSGFRWSNLSVAAIVCLTLFAGFFFFYKNKDTRSGIPGPKTNDVAPGGNKAFLILADGKRISLTDAPAGTLSDQEGTAVVKAADGRVVYQAAGNLNSAAAVLEYHTIETPEGGQYQVDLPDGTKVWLNALSSIKFPSNFARQPFRKVELTGEAYFEVAKVSGQPFKVLSGKQEVEVLGTHFNINAYADEPAVSTTLLEGSVRVNGRFLKPGQQSVLSSNGLNMVKADAEAVVAWKNGLFMFDNERLESVMRKLSRWYGVRISYSDEAVKELIFGGTVSRFDKVSKVLRMMELTGDVHFKLEGKQITVLP